MSIKEKIYSFIARRQPQREAKWPHWERVKHVLVLYQRAKGVEIYRFISQKRRDKGGT